MDFYLKAEDEAALMADIERAGIVTKTDEGWQLNGYSLRLIGQIEKQVGEVDGEPVMQTIPGYHANLLGDLTDEQQQTLAAVLLPERPQNPVEVWWVS